MKDYYDASDEEKSLKGERVLEVWQYGNDLIKFVCQSGKVLWWSAVGDCCSHSWFEHVDFDAMKDAEVTSELEDSGYACEDIDEYDVLKTYQYTLKTTKGHCDVEMRNSSNGYYGGDIIAFERPLDQYHSDVAVPLEGKRIL